MQTDEVQQLDGAEFFRGRVVELLLVRRTAGHRRNGRVEERVQYQRIFHIRRRGDGRVGQRHAKVRIRIGGKHRRECRVYVKRTSCPEVQKK